MAKPFIHAKSSVARFGGQRSDYQKLHDLMDETKASHASMRHRAIFHSSYGIYLIEKILGLTIVNSDGVEVSTRDIAEWHVIEDLGKIPSIDEWLSEMTEKSWMSGAKRLNLEIVD